MEIDVNIVIPVEAMTKKNHSQIIRNGGHVFLIPSKQYLEFEKQCMPYLKNYRIEINYPINLKCVFYRKTRRKVDLPNLLNSICDILVKYKVISDDNCKIVASFNGSCVKYDKDNPRIEISISKGELCWND